MSSSVNPKETFQVRFLLEEQAPKLQYDKSHSLILNISTFTISSTPKTSTTIKHCLSALKINQDIFFSHRLISLLLLSSRRFISTLHEN